MAPLYSSLNSAQQRAVRHGNTPLLVLAGAGTGKTSVITHRIAHFIRDARVPPWVREMYDARDVLRAEWRELERRGEARDWVRGVGEGGWEDWVELMRRVLKRAQERPKEDADDREAALARSEGEDGGEVRIARPPAGPSEEKSASNCLVN